MCACMYACGACAELVHMRVCTRIIFVCGCVSARMPYVAAYQCVKLAEQADQFLSVRVMACMRECVCDCVCACVRACNMDVSELCVRLCACVPAYQCVKLTEKANQFLGETIGTIAHQLQKKNHK